MCVFSLKFSALNLFKSERKLRLMRTQLPFLLVYAAIFIAIFNPKILCHPHPDPSVLLRKAALQTIQS